MSLDDFSGGYYSVPMSVQPYDGGPVIEHTLYDFIDQEVYTKTNAPIKMRVGFDGSGHFTIRSESAVPRNVLALPEELMTEAGIETAEHEVFVLKPEYSYLLEQSERLRSRFANERSE